MAITVRALTKRFGSVTAVDGVSFDVATGSVFAFVGTNGAGKSTTIGCVTTTMGYDAGEITIDGRDVRRDGAAVRRRIGVVFQESLLDPLLTVRENLTTRARFYSRDKRAIARRVRELGDLIGIGGLMSRRYGQLSGGQKRRVDIARALLHSPSILFLDEPTAGLDPASRALVWSTIHTLRTHHDLTVFLTTHYMEETEEADRVCIIDAGHVIAEGTPAELRSLHSRSVLTVVSSDRPNLITLAAHAGLDVDQGGEVSRIVVPDADTARHLLRDHGDKVLDFEFRHGTMDDVFLALTGLAPEAVAARTGARR